MADVPSSIGYIEVLASGIVANADSSDVGNQPDAEAMLGTVTFTANAPNPLRGKDGDRWRLVAVATVVCGLNANGDLVPPTDGSDAGVGGSGATPGVYLVAPNQASLSHVNWVWKASFKKASGQKWTDFNITFSGVPGQVIDLADPAYIATTSSAPTQVAFGWEVLSTELEEDFSNLSTVLPDAKVGQLILFTDTGDLSRIGAL